MENAAEALKMAGAVMIFVLALSVIIFSFGQARQSADTILDYRDRETAYIDAQDYYEISSIERKVDLETIIPSIFRAYLENYKIVFDGLGNEPIYYLEYIVQTQPVVQTQSIPKYTLDIETSQNAKYNNVALGTDERKIEFLKGILMGDFGPEINAKSIFENRYKVDLTGCRPLYDRLKDNSIRTITEHLGVYQQNPEVVSEANRTEKRVITYRIIR